MGTTAGQGYSPEAGRNFPREAASTPSLQRNGRSQ